MERKIKLVAKQVELHSYNQIAEDFEYWKSKSPIERLQAVTILVRQNLLPNQRMDKSYSSQKVMGNDA